MDSGRSTPIAVQTRQLARRFGSRWALAGIDLEIPAGSACMLTGANGSGKTTLLRCIATALSAHHGELRIFGIDPTSAPHEARQHISLISHATRLYEDLGPRDNLRTWASLAGVVVEVDKLLDDVGLPAVAENPVRTFSAGMRRRLAFAVGLLLPRPLLLLDEPFSALDPQGRTLIKGRLDRAKAAGSTLVIATHLPKVAASLCDHAIHLENGRVVWRGSPADSPAVEPEE